jgi:hypothetical protein
MILHHDLGRSLQLTQPDRDLPLWRYVYGGKPKPFFHPLCTPAGHLLSLFEPHDHPWHRGLWFTIKFINGENFWEENDAEPWGTQSTAVPPTVTPGAGGKISVFSRQQWIRPRRKDGVGAGIVFEEQRQFDYVPLDETAYALDLFFLLTPTQPLKLDRTLFTTWGGYGGLTFRGNRNWQETRLLFSDGSTNDRPTGIFADWADLSGKIDGGPNQTAGLTIFDHPTNPRHPTPWYGGTGPGHYINAAFLFHEPLELPANSPLTLRYRVLVHDGILSQTQLAAAYQAYLDQPHQA